MLDRVYHIDVRLAAGGVGAIYRATHVITGAPVALKVLHTKLASLPDVVARRVRVLSDGDVRAAGRR